MLVELDIQNFAIIDRVRLELGPAFNVLTGETGAGKSILVDAVGLVLGARADTSQVRTGADRAVIQAVFAPPDPDALAEVLEAYGVEPEADLIVDREVLAAGRSVARINGRVVPVRALSELGAALVDVHGQTETASLLREPEHLVLLDRYAGTESQRREFAERVGALKAIETEIQRLRRDEAELARHLDMLEFQVEEIDAARLQPDEDEELKAERNRLANAEKLATLADEAYRGLRGRGDAGPGAVDGAEQAADLLAELARIDPELEPVRESLTDLAVRLADTAREIRDYRDGVAFDPERLEVVEDRLAEISELKRKYGRDIEAVLAYADDARRQLEEIGGAEERIARLEKERTALRAELGEAAEALSQQRRAAAERLEPAVEAEMAELGMPDSDFVVDFQVREDDDGIPVGDVHLAFDATGADQVSFLVTTNPGEPPRSLVRVASGGETARLMLALKTVLSSADNVPTLIFDEIDAGIGGRIGSVVGQKLWRLSGRHQVLCVTHLAQVAAFADGHLQVQKAQAEGRTTTRVAALDRDRREEELMHMLGTTSAAGRENARQLLQEAEVWKAGRTGAANGTGQAEAAPA